MIYFESDPLFYGPILPAKCSLGQTETVLT